MDFEQRIKEDRAGLLEDIRKLVSIDSVEAAPEEGMPFGKGAANPAEGKNAITAVMMPVRDLALYNELGEIADFYMERIGFSLCGEHIGLGFQDEVSGKLIFSIDNRVPVTYKCGEAGRLLVETLMDVYREVTGDAAAEPQVDGACSYARALDNCVAFGALLPEQPNLMHQKNEYLELDKLDDWMKIYLEAIYRLAIVKAASDPEYQNQLFDEFGL